MAPTLAVNTAAGPAAALWRDRVSGVYPSCGAFPPVQREDVPSLSLRVPFSQVAQLLEDGRFAAHRSYVVNPGPGRGVCPDEVQMRSGARVPPARGRAAEVRAAVTDWAKCPGRCGKE